jgi:acetolactate synthase-1/2/3 large subunit
VRYQKDAETVKFGRYTTACHLAPVDHAGIARACGVDAVRVEAIDELDAAIARGLEARAPYLIDVITDPDAHPPLSLYDGSLDIAEPVTR